MKELNWRTLGDVTQWLSTWIDSGNKTIRCTAKDVVFDLYDDEGDILSYTFHLDSSRRPYIVFEKAQHLFSTCELSSEPVINELDVKDERKEKRALMYKTTNTPSLINELDVKVERDFLFGNLDKTKPSRPLRYASREVNGMDIIDLAEHWDLSFAEGNILKYLLRHKGEDISDLEKIIDYANRRIKQLNNK